MATAQQNQSIQDTVAQTLQGLQSLGTTGKQKYIGIQAGQELPKGGYSLGSEYWLVHNSWTPDQVWQLQQHLIHGGFIDTDFQRGVWDKTSQDGLARVMALANNSPDQNGQTPDWQTVLTNAETVQPMEINPDTGLPRPKARGGRALTLEYTNPADVATIAQGVAYKSLGRSLTDPELQKFQSLWQGEEKAFQTSKYNASAAGGGASITKEPGMDTAAQQYAQSLDPVGYQASQMLPLVDRLNTMLRGVPGLESNVRTAGTGAAI